MLEFHNLKTTILSLVEKYQNKIVNLQNQIKEYKEQEERDNEIIASWNVSSLEEVTEIINNHNNHKCPKNKNVKYLSHKDLLNNNYYSQMINTNYILNQQLKEEKEKYDRIYKEVSYFRNLYMNDDDKREMNRKLDSLETKEDSTCWIEYEKSLIEYNNNIDKPIDYYINFYLYGNTIFDYSKKDEISKNNKTFVLYRFRNIVKKVIYKNKKKIFNKKINTAIANMKTYLANMLPQKVTLGDALYKKYKKERIQNNINKVKIVKNKIILINKIKKYLEKYRKQKKKAISVLEKNKKIITSIINANDRYKKSSLYDELYKDNRNKIEKFSNYYEKFILENKKDEIKLVQEYYDKNHNRFLRILELFNYIKKDEELFNSSYIFDYYKFSDVSIKNNNFKKFIPELRKALGFKYSGDSRKGKVTLGNALYDKYFNESVEKDEEEYIISDNEFVSTCIYCDEPTEELQNGSCQDCLDKMINPKDEKEDYYEDSDYEEHVIHCVFCENTENLEPSTGTCKDCLDKMNNFI